MHDAAPAGRSASRARIDWLGAALLAGAAHLRSCSSPRGAGASTPGTRSRSSASPPRAVALLALFVAQERRAPEPILPLRLFREPVFDVVSAALFLTTCAFFAAIVFMPLYLQVVTGASATARACCCCRCCSPATASTASPGA